MQNSTRKLHTEVMQGENRVKYILVVGRSIRSSFNTVFRDGEHPVSSKQRYSNRRINGPPKPRWGTCAPTFYCQWYDPYVRRIARTSTLHFNVRCHGCDRLSRCSYMLPSHGQPMSALTRLLPMAPFVAFHIYPSAGSTFCCVLPLWR